MKLKSPELIISFLALAISFISLVYTYKNTSEEIKKEELVNYSNVKRELIGEFLDLLTKYEKTKKKLQVCENTSSNDQNRKSFSKQKELVQENILLITNTINDFKTMGVTSDLELLFNMNENINHILILKQSLDYMNRYIEGCPQIKEPNKLLHRKNYSLPLAFFR